MGAVGAWFLFGLAASALQAAPAVDFNREIRRILSDHCYKCHGPDPSQRKGGKGTKDKAGLRLDTRDGALADLGGHAAIVPGQPDQSELIRRVTAANMEDRMPPAETGKTLTSKEVELLRAWIQQGAPYAGHWAYEKPKRSPLPETKNTAWPVNPIDRFILARLEQEGLSPSPEADRYALIRRVSLDLTGLPPTLEEVDAFVGDGAPGAYERLVDRLLKKKSFGEHWARLWLDQARYADSTGYADDPMRTIWAFRDYVIRAFNENKPFDQFTLEQIAGDLLPDPTDDQLIATAFHRNTLTNNEGGTSDEEFRNVAIVDRVNTTMEVWMGTTMACAQCHTHKYDPISQVEYFKLFAILNNTEDADRKDETPVLALYTDEQKSQRQAWEKELAALTKAAQTPTPALLESQHAWESGLKDDLLWNALRPATLTSREGAVFSQDEEDVIRIAQGAKTDVYTFEARVTESRNLTALKLETLPDPALPGQGPGFAAGNFVVTRVLASVLPPSGHRPAGRFVRIAMAGREKILSLAEVQVFQGSNNLARGGQATQSSTGFNGPAALAIDGNTDGDFDKAKSTTHTEISENPWWELDLKSVQAVDRVALWNRTDGGYQSRLKDFRISLLDEARQAIWELVVDKAPEPNAEFSLSGVRAIAFAGAYADFSQKDFNASSVLDEVASNEKGWAIGSKNGQPHSLTLVPKNPVELPAGSSLSIVIEQLSKHENHTLGKLRLSSTSDVRASEYARTPAGILDVVRIPPDHRSEVQREDLTRHYLTIAPALEPERKQIAALSKQLKELKPYTTVPIQRELAAANRRKTQLQYRGNYLDLGQETPEGLPQAFGPASPSAFPSRLDLARWLISPDNPLTSRVMVNRLWESIFGIGIVSTSEDFGSQGELPSHPQLLDWLAVEWVESHWDIKRLLKLMVTSAAYRQSSKVSPELVALDPDNRWLARGPRFRLSAETIRDQTLYVAGLLSDKMFGPPVNPPQPKLGISAAFGSGIDWETSAGPDRYRRGIYTTWRRSNPYPSMAAFDAPNREVCTVRRERTNTPLQALVTLNDPVYLEAAQALSRRVAAAGSSPVDKARYAFRICLARTPSEAELSRLLQLYGKSYARYAEDLSLAKKMATDPLGPIGEGADVAELAAWTMVGNVLMNLDEMLMKR